MAISCTPGTPVSCYDGPPGSDTEGTCQRGTGTCNATGDGWDDCQGQILPSIDECHTALDEDCSGVANDHCGLWLRHIGTSGMEPLDLAVDGAGAIAIAGRMSNDLDFGAGVVEPCGGVAQGESRGFVAVLEEDGAHRWTRCFGAAGGDDEVATVAFDAAGGLLAAGTFDTGTESPSGAIAAVGDQDGFVTKLNAGDGAFAWFESFGAVGYAALANVAVTGDDHAVVLADHRGAVADLFGTPYDEGGTRFHTLVEADTNGASLWQVRVPDHSTGRNGRVAVTPDDDIIVATGFGQTPTIGGFPLSDPIEDDGMVVARFDGADGQTVDWATVITGTGDEIPWRVVTNGSVVGVIGYFDGGIDFGDGEIAALGEEDGFAALLDATTGVVLWSKTYGSTAAAASSQNQEMLAAAVGPDDSLYVGGAVEGAVDIDGYPIDVLASSTDFSDGFVCKVSRDGRTEWVRRFGGGSDTDVSAMAFDVDGKLLLLGEVDSGSTVTFSDQHALSQSGIWLLRIDP
jgi:hypothetical protein